MPQLFNQVQATTKVTIGQTTETIDAETTKSRNTAAVADATTVVEEGLGGTAGDVVGETTTTGGDVTATKGTISSTRTNLTPSP